MPGKRLDKKQMESYKKLLEKIREDRLYDLRKMTAINSGDGSNGSEENASHAMHMADVATDMYDKEFNLNLASNDRDLLQKVDAALKRIEEGTYGLCQACQKPIPAARLKAIPYVENCLKCQEALENAGG